MIDINMIELELKHMAMQAEAFPAPEIQKLSPAQMAALASALGRKHGLNVEFGNFSTAATDGSTILLPLTSRENSWIVRGYLDHETAHVRLTDFGGVPNNTPFRKTLWNVLEDVRIEGLMPLLYPGMASNYRTLIRELRRKTPALFDVNESDPPEAIIATYISLMLRSLYLRQAELAESALKAQEVFVDIFGEDLEHDLFSLIMRVSNAKNTRDVVLLVDEIIELLKRYASESHQSRDQAEEDRDGDEEDRGETSEPGTEESDGEAGDASGKPRGENADDVQEEVSEERNPGQGSDSQAVEETPPADDGNPTGPGKDTPCAASPQSAIEQALESQEETGDFGQQLRDLAHDKEPAGAFNKIQVGRAATPSELQSAGYQLQPVKASTQLVANLSSRLRGLLQAEGLKQSTPCVSGNRIARQRLHRIRAGDPKLFLKKNPEKMVNTAVHLLVDNSGSMDDNGRFHTAREVVLALVKALEVISRVNLAVSLFPAYYPYSNGTGSRQVPVAAVLPHGQLPGSKIRYPPEPEGQTPLDAAVRYAASTMLNVTEPRRIMLILTDGEPDSAWTAEVAIQEAGALGIEVVCLGIETIVCPEIFPRHEVVRSVQDLPEKTFKLLEHMLCS